MREMIVDNKIDQREILMNRLFQGSKEKYFQFITIYLSDLWIEKKGKTALEDSLKDKTKASRQQSRKIEFVGKFTNFAEGPNEQGYLRNRKNITSEPITRTDAVHQSRLPLFA